MRDGGEEISLETGGARGPVSPNAHRKKRHGDRAQGPPAQNRQSQENDEERRRRVPQKSGSGRQMFWTRKLAPMNIFNIDPIT